MQVKHAKTSTQADTANADLVQPSDWNADHDVTLLAADVTAALGYTPESTTAKGAAGGYAPLGGDSLIPAIYLPSYTDDVLEFASYAALPATGEAGKIYITVAAGPGDTPANAQYRWTGSAYVMLVASPGSTDAVPEGAGNLYFTYARVRDTVLTGLSLAVSAAVTSADSLLTAAGKLQRQISDALAAIAAHIADMGNPHGTTKATVGLGNVQDVDTTNAANISGGVLPAGRLSGSYGISVTGSAGSTVAALGAGDGLTSAGTFNGSTARTFAVNSTVVRTTGDQSLGDVKTFLKPIRVVNTFDVDGSGPSEQQTGLYVADLGTTVGTTLNPTVTAAIIGQASTIRSVGFSTDVNGYLYGFRTHTNAGVYTWQSKTKFADALTTARTINGVSFNGTANITVTASTTAALTAGDGMTSAGTFNGSTARTFAVDSTVIRTAGGQIITGLMEFAGGAIASANSVGAALIVQQTGAGYGLRVEAPDISIKAGATGTTGALNFTFNTNGTVYGSLSLPYDTRATVGLKLESTGGYPITLNSGNGVKLQEDGATTLELGTTGNVVLGGTLASQINFYNRRDVSGNTTSYAFYTNVEIQADVTTSAYLHRSLATTQASAFTLGNLTHYYVSQGAFGAGSSVTTQVGFEVASSMSGAANNTAFLSRLNSASNTYAFYGLGTAISKFNGLVDISASTAGQIKFPATANASSDANTFDDYEKGDWTPTGSGISFSAATGKYTKKGREVTAEFDVTWPSTANASTAQVASLPFTAGSFGSVAIGLVTRANSLAYVASGQPYCVMYDPSGGGATMTNANMSTVRVIGTAIYFV